MTEVEAGTTTVEPEPEPKPEPEISSATWRLAWVIAFGAFAGGLDTSLINIALKTIQDEFHTSLGLAQWISSAYLLALAVSLPVLVSRSS